MMTLFRTAKVSDRITCITDVAGTHFFLVEGDRSAALIDTGSGCGDLGDLITSLTALPVKCILTHGHVDHAMGSGCFEQVWLHENDRELYAATARRRCGWATSAAAHRAAAIRYSASRFQRQTSSPCILWIGCCPCRWATASILAA